MKILAVHLYHDSTISLYLDGEYQNIELERFYSKRHYDWKQEGRDLDSLITHVLKIRRDFDAAIYVGSKDPDAIDLFRKLNISTVSQVDHHLAHAASAFYQSPFHQSLLISYDGGGNDGTFRTFLGSREKGIQSLNENWFLNLGIPYRALAYSISDIQKPNDNRELSNAGKLMGLSAYGQIRPEWIDAITKYFLACNGGRHPPGQMYKWVVSNLSQLGSEIRINLSRNSITGPDAYDLARTGQHVFETLFLDRVLPQVKKYQLPVCLSGGCALNVLVNQRLAEAVDQPVFVPPNPNDCGLALGAILHRIEPKKQVRITYSGPPILDLDQLSDFVTRFGAKETAPPEIAELIFDGKVVAVMRGHAEHGPRALGNRSILCDPGDPGMKERLNGKIKFRESFRPFAPVIRAEDIEMFFENPRNDLSYMSFNPTVKPIWRKAFNSALHVDGTSRVQTVTYAQNVWLYDLLTHFSRMSGYGALLNTSFNSKGKPMVARISDALSIFFETDTDYLVIEDWLFSK